jgi:hypothetical protein
MAPVRRVCSRRTWRCKGCREENGHRDLNCKGVRVCRRARWLRCAAVRAAVAAVLVRALRCSCVRCALDVVRVRRAHTPRSLHRAEGAATRRQDDTPQAPQAAAADTQSGADTGAQATLRSVVRQAVCRPLHALQRRRARHTPQRRSHVGFTACSLQHPRPPVDTQRSQRRTLLPTRDEGVLAPLCGRPVSAPCSLAPRSHDSPSLLAHTTHPRSHPTVTNRALRYEHVSLALDCLRLETITLGAIAPF